MLQRNIRRFWKNAAWRWWQKGSHLRSSHIITHCKHTAAHRSAIACNVFCINSALRAVCVADASSSSMIHICIVDAAGSESQDYAKHIARSIGEDRRCVWRKEGRANPAPTPQSQLRCASSPNLGEQLLMGVCHNGIRPAS